MTIYTKKGDDGTSGLFGTKERFSKDAHVFETVGTVDELNAFIGLVSVKTGNSSLKKLLKGVQSDLMLINSIIAGADIAFGVGKTKKFENYIDKLDIKLKPLTKFVLPGGSEVSALLHVARSVSRRAERNIVGLAKQHNIKTSVLAYANRLSDLLFQLAREANLDEKVDDEIWKIGRGRSK